VEGLQDRYELLLKFLASLLRERDDIIGFIWMGREFFNGN